ncbi:Fcf2 pre-rRNA processing-domain-containing protein [Chaetomium sp. MPI-CAGE-AT-0009]|nr:Fcf2 pre-rRNA processing-domain-containing protein [Chaetomium sp. MPI-CAGE-AT-0009]
MAATFGLPDDEIDRLLSEAEARLSGNGSLDTVAVSSTAAAAAKTPATVVAPPAPTAGEQTSVPEKKSEKLTVRVPQLSQKKKGPKDTLGADWFNLPRTNLTPELKRDLQALRMRDVAAMGKQFFKKDSRKDLIPEYSQVGTIIAGATDGVNNRLTRKERKRTIVEEILSSENVGKLKSKYQDIQERKRSGKKGYYKKLVAGRRKRNG